MKYFISGGMTGYTEYNFPAFNAEAERLRAEGKYVINPAECAFEDIDNWSNSLRTALIELVINADALVVLPEWWKSEGAKREVLLAKSFGLPIFEAGTMNEVEVKAEVSVFPTSPVVRAVFLDTGDGLFFKTSGETRIFEGDSYLQHHGHWYDDRECTVGYAEDCWEDIRRFKRVA